MGLAPLDAWQGGAAGAASYERLLAAKMREDPVHRHDHVYGASLAVRADAYLDVGGFCHVRHGEDQALVDALAERLATVDREARAAAVPALGVVETGPVR